jgi:transposase-like protein
MRSFERLTSSESMRRSLSNVPNGVKTDHGCDAASVIDGLGEIRAVHPNILHVAARVLALRGHLTGGGPRAMPSKGGRREQPATIIPMTTTGRAQQYDHGLRDLVRRIGDVTIATDLGVSRSTARGWLRQARRVVVSLDVTNLRTSELQQEILALRRRVKKLTALLRLALALLRSWGFTLAHERLPDGRAKMSIRRAVDRARACVPLRALL